MAGIYIHIPFCKQRCTYCNFHFSTSLALKEALLTALHKELESRNQYLLKQSVETIYLGGGTPSLLSADEINRLFDTISNHYTIHALQEVTLEANPDDLTNDYVKSLSSTPVNRLSIGVQSFQDDDLKFMHRAHTASQADYAIKSAQDRGFEKLTIDLIYGSPHLTDADWKQNITRVQQLQIPHFSAYALTVESGTLLHHQIRKEKLPPLDQDKAASQLGILMDTAMDLGYEHYEISNLALPQQYAIHNTNYWMGHHYLGIGPSAHSFDGVSRRWNIANNALYIKQVLTTTPQPYFEEEQLSAQDRLHEYIMTSLRTQWGCDLKKVKENFGQSYTEAILDSATTHLQRKILQINNDILTLTREGKFFADRIASDLFV